MSPRGVQPYVLLDFQRVFVGTDVLHENAVRAANTRKVRRRQLELSLPRASKAREATDAELRDLLRRLPRARSWLTSRRDKRACRTALARRWVHWEGEMLHLTADGRDALARLMQPEGPTL